MFSRRLRPEGGAGGERKATLHCIAKRQLCRKRFPPVGTDAPTLACGHGLQPYGALDCFKGRTEGDWGRAESPQCARRRKPLPPAGNDAPTPARGQGLQPYGALTLFFRWRKKSVQKKASGTATLAARPAARRGLRSAVAPFGAVLDLGSLRSPFWGKSPLLPIFERGSSQCRAQHSWTANIYVRARSCSLFSSFKKGKAFSLRCLSPLCSPAVGVGQAYPLQGGKFQCGLGIFAAQKASVSLISRWPF